MSNNKSVALRIVKEHFPKVTKVVDANKGLTIEVTKRDVNSAQVRNHSTCAMAVACKREMQAEGMIVSTNIAYVIKNNTATRYRVPESVSREVVAFDRGAEFSTGTYHLRVPVDKLGAHKNGAGSHAKTPTKKKAIVHRHKTDDIRAVLGSK